MSPTFLAATAALVGLMWFIEGLKTQAMLHMMGEHLNLSKAIRVNLAAGFVGGITPFTSGGPPTHIYLLYRLGIPLNKCMAVVAARTLLTFLYFGILVPVILLRFRAQLGLPPSLNFLVSLALALALLAVVVFLYIIWRPGTVQTATTWLVSTRFVGFLFRNRDRKATANRASIEAQKFSRSLQLIFGSGSVPGTALVLLYTFLSWSIFFSLAPLVLAGLGLHVPLLKVITRQVVVFFIISYIPIPGGSGIAELGFATVFSTLIPSHLLPIFVGGWRFLTYHATLLAGSVSLATAHR